MSEDKNVILEKDWIHEGIRCVAVFYKIPGHRCGYVQIPNGHPFFGKSWEDQETSAVKVHGGITYGEDKCPALDWKFGEWWIGFDCAHLGDKPDLELMTDGPIKEIRRAFSGQVGIRDLRYVISECESLASQVKRVSEVRRLHELALSECEAVVREWLGNTRAPLAVQSAFDSVVEEARKGSV